MRGAGGLRPCATGDAAGSGDGVAGGIASSGTSDHRPGSLSGPTRLDDAGFQLVRDALTEDLVVFFRDQDIEGLVSRGRSACPRERDPGMMPA